MEKVNNTCGTKTQAACAIYESTVNKNSSLVGECDVSVESALKDLFGQIEEINSDELGKLCIEYLKNDKGRITISKALEAHEKEICELKAEVKKLENLKTCSIDISKCGLDLTGIVDACGDQPQTLTDLLQILINNERLQ